MKKLLILGMFVLSFVSCDDFIDLKPENAVTYTNAMETPQELEAILSNAQAIFNGVFTPLSLQEQSGAYCNGAQLGGMQPGPADAMYHKWDNPMMDSGYWGMYYNIIGYSNIIISNTKSTWKEEYQNYFLGQAHFLKAISYWELARRWGEVPIVPDNDYESPAVKKSSNHDVLEKATQEALEAFKYLPKFKNLNFADGKKIDNKQYANKEIASTLLAYIYAWRASTEMNISTNKSKEYWAESEKYASMLIDVKGELYGYAMLEPSIASLTSNTLNSRYGDESILELEYNTIYTKVMHVTDFYIGNKTFAYPYKYNALEGDRVEMSTSCKRIIDLYGKNTNDARKLEWFDISHYDESADIEWPDVALKFERVEAFPGFWIDRVVGGVKDIAINRAYIKKFTKEFIYKPKPNEPKRFYNFDINKVVWRLADLILLRAEVRNFLGNTAGAISDLNMIRNRANAPTYPASYDNEDLQKSIFKERERELIYENHRFWDVMRNKNYYKTELPALFRVITEQEIKDGAMFLPIPRSANEYNKLMTPNKYWYYKKN